MAWRSFFSRLGIGRRCESKPATCQAVVALLGTIVGAYLAVYTMSHSLRHAAEIAQSASEESIKVAQIQLMDALEQKIDNDPIVRKMHAAIVECNPRIPLTKEHVGEGYVPYYDVNRFISFLNNVSFYWAKGLLTYEMVDHLYGAFIREAYLDKDLRSYIELLRSAGGEESAAKHFLALGEKLVTDGLVRNSDQLTGMCLGIVRKTWFLNLKYGCSGG
jgi:hypothetical protein